MKKYSIYMLYSLRPKQWIKNLFIFLPLFFGNKLLVFPDNLNTLYAFLVFSLAASSVYLMNDIIDLEQDRLHPIKRLRPIASGIIKQRDALFAALFLGILSITFAFKLNLYFGCIIVIYFVFTAAYSFVLKKIVLLDVFCLGGFFLLRVISGSLAADVPLSQWIIIITTLLALFLGFNKRRQELALLGNKTNYTRSVLDKYNLYFIDQMIVIITASLLIAYMLYTVDAGPHIELGRDKLIFTIPFVYYGIFRYLYLIHINKYSGDPTLMLFSDKMSQLNIVLWFVVCLLIIY